jgi:hypothetical protein
VSAVRKLRRRNKQTEFIPRRRRKGSGWLATTRGHGRVVEITAEAARAPRSL